MKARGALRLALLGGACGGADPKAPEGAGATAEGVDGGDGDTGGQADTGPTGHAHTPDPGPETPSPAAVEETLAQAIGAFAALGPSLIFDAQDAALDEGSGPCPGLFAAVGFTTGWSADCSTASGWGFDGRGQAAWLPDLTVDGVRLDRYGTFITTTTFTHPGGATLMLDGRGDYALRGAGSTLVFEAALAGTFDATPGTEPWLDLSALEGAPSLSVAWEGGGASGSRWLRLEGGISGGAAAGEAGVGLRMEGLELREEAGACAATGAVVALLADGARVRRSFDGAPCAGCGPASDGAGQAVGEVCVDLAPLWQPEEWPW